MENQAAPVEKTAEQIEAENKAAAKAAADAAKAEAKAQKEAAKAAADAAKKEAKEKADAARAEAKKAKEEAAAAAKKAKEDAAAAAAKAKADAAAAKQAEKTKVVMPSQNGITRPKADGACGKVWALADAESARLQQPVPISNLLTAARAAGLNDATTRTQYARWKTFNGVFGSVPKIVEVAPAAAETASNDQTNTAAA
jgi:hypothetical protein